MANIEKLIAIFPQGDITKLNDLLWMKNKLKTLDSIKNYPIDQFLEVYAEGAKRLETISLTYIKDGNEVTETYSRQDFFSL